MSKTNVDVNIKDLLEKINLEETDIFIVQDDQNTKRVSLRNFVKSIVKDDELPTDYRIYSALKIQSMINAIDKYCTDGIGGVQNSISNLEKFKATRDGLNKLKEDLLENINTRVTTEEMNEILDTKMSKTYKITSADMDTSSDDSKIKLVNLSQEVMDELLSLETYEKSRNILSDILEITHNPLSEVERNYALLHINNLLANYKGNS